jgi:hypothetical protein
MSSRRAERKAQQAGHIIRDIFFKYGPAGVVTLLVIFALLKAQG